MRAYGISLHYIEMLKKEFRDLLEQYRREAPEIFGRLPLPKALAEELGCPISEEVLPLSAYLRKHLEISAGLYDEAETVYDKITITPAPQTEVETNTMLEITELKVEPTSQVIETSTETGFVPK